MEILERDRRFSPELIHPRREDSQQFVRGKFLVSNSSFF